MILLVAVLWALLILSVFGAPLQEVQKKQGVQKVEVEPRAVIDEDRMGETRTPYPQTVAREKRKHGRKYIFVPPNEDSMFSAQTDEDLGLLYYKVEPRALVTEDVLEETLTLKPQTMARKKINLQRKYIILSGNEGSFYPIQLDED